MSAPRYVPGDVEVFLGGERIEVTGVSYSEDGGRPVTAPWLGDTEIRWIIPRPTQAERNKAKAARRARRRP